MKKATVSLQELAESLRAVATDVQNSADFNLDDPSVRELVTNETLVGEFFTVGAPSAAPSYGRGQRVRVTIGWLWWPARMLPGQGAELIASKIRSVPGVEHVAEPCLDPQLGIVWQTSVTIRLSQ
jgi:hypothetical protein